MRLTLVLAFLALAAPAAHPQPRGILALAAPAASAWPRGILALAAPAASAQPRGILALAAPAAFAQPREFLRGDEVDQIREAQEANDRMKLYVLFARNRLDAVEAALKKPASDERAATVHDLLWEYQKLVDALDDLIDVNVEKRELIRRGLAPVVGAEPELLKRLQAIEQQNPSDRETYNFALKEAIETTESSIEENRKALAKQPADKRTQKEIDKEMKQDAKDREEKERKKPPQQ